MDDVLLQVPAELEQLEHIQSFAAERATLAGLAPSALGKLALALEEVFVNICHYAYPDRSGSVDLHTWTENGEFVIEIADTGMPFDGLALPDPDTSAELDDREIGGLGWFLIRQLVTAADYRREGDRNLLRLRLSIDPEETPNAAKDA